jgi:hypothetical protein
MGMTKFLMGAALICAALGSPAQSLNGTWSFDKASDYEGLIKQPTPAVTTLQITNHEMSLTSRCVVKFLEKKYYFHEPFQLLLKGGADERTINLYLNRQFAFKLAGIHSYYEADLDQNCNELGSDFFIDGDQLLVVRGSSLFYSFKRVNGGIETASTQLLRQLRSSQLPFNLGAYISACLGHWPKQNGVPQSSIKCAPVYSVYVATAKATDPISLLVASHAYAKNGARYADDDYDNPVAHGLHPVFTVLPPMNGVVVVRVDDLEGRNEERDVMSGVYLAIKDGKVTDQLNDGCDFDTQYVCSVAGEKTKYKLLGTGKFAKMP